MILPRSVTVLLLIFTIALLLIDFAKAQAEYVGGSTPSYLLKNCMSIYSGVTELCYSYDDLQSVIDCMTNHPCAYPEAGS